MWVNITQRIVNININGYILDTNMKFKSPRRHLLLNSPDLYVFCQPFWNTFCQAVGLSVRSCPSQQSSVICSIRFVKISTTCSSKHLKEQNTAFVEIILHSCSLCSLGHVLSAERLRNPVGRGSKHIVLTTWSRNSVKRSLSLLLTELLKA